MKVRLVELQITFKRAEVTIPFAEQLTFIWGQMGVGKSSIAGLVDWCLGGDSKFKYAVDDELVAASLLLDLNEKRVRIDRDRERKGAVRLIWEGDDGEPRNELVRLKSDGGDWDPAKPEVLSDHLFVLAGVTPLRVPQSGRNRDAPLLRLSFRDFLAFCYLPQERLAVSLLRFGEEKNRKSLDVMRALLGLFSPRQQRLQTESDSLLQRSKRLELQAKEVTAFLDQLEIDDLSALEEKLEAARRSLEAAEQEQQSLRDEELPRDHPIDSVRQRSEALARQLAEQRQSLAEIGDRLERDRRLRAEMITAQLKIERSTVAVDILSGVHFGHCPQCGNTVEASTVDDSCSLCHQAVRNDDSVLPAGAARADLQSRVDELDISITQHQLAQRRESRRLRELQDQKAKEDDALAGLLKTSESKRLSSVREAARRLALARSEVDRYESASRLRSEVGQLKSESHRLASDRQPILTELAAETAALEEKEQTRSKIAEAFKEALLEVHMPDVVSEDSVVIEENLEPLIRRARGGKPYGFDGLSSGMRTLFQCCYALAIHRVAREEGLMLPNFLIIDTPTTNIDSEVDGEVFHGFFRYLYKLLQGPMRGTQILLIDNKFEPVPPGIDVVKRQMLRDDPEYPRLVPYAPAGDPEKWDSEGRDGSSEAD